MESKTKDIPLGRKGKYFGRGGGRKGRKVTIKN